MSKTPNYQLTKLTDMTPADVVAHHNQLAEEIDEVLTDELAKFEQKTNRNRALGYAGLGADGKISTAQVPEATIGGKPIRTTPLQDNDALKFDAKLQAWVNVQANIDRTPPGNTTSIAADTSSNSVTIKWTDPVDADWFSTRVVRKLGSYPVNVNDGTTIVTSVVRDQYKVNGYVDSGLVNGAEYFYQLFPTDAFQNVNVNPANQIKATPRAVLSFGLSWNKTTGQVARLGNAAGRNVSTTDGIKTSDFSDVFPWGGMRRCNLTSNGQVSSYQGDPTFAHDGTKGNVMVEIPKYWYKKTPTADGYEFWISNGPSSGFEIHPAFYRDRGTGKADEVEKRYIGAFLGTKVGSKLHSYSNVFALNFTDIATFREMAQTHGTGWGIEDFYLISAIQLMYLIEYANFNSQSAIGVGDVNATYGAGGDGLRVGATANYGNNTFGKTVVDPTSRSDTTVSYRGIEDIFGGYSRYVDGIFITSNNMYLIGNRAFNNTGAGYTTSLQSLFAGDAYGQISDIFPNPFAGFLPKTIEGTSNSGLYDSGNYTSSAHIHVGGDCNDDYAAGIFRMNTASTIYNTGQFARVGARLAY